MAVETETVTVVLPAKNEARSLASVVPLIRTVLPEAEIIVVDDGSTDDTRDVLAGLDVTAIHHPYSIGNGAAIKSGARAARSDVIVFMDADGQHDPRDIPLLLDTLAGGFKMVVGARGNTSQASVGRLCANKTYNRLASWITGHEVRDLTSGFRAVRRKQFLEFLFLLPNGFSYPTTITMAFFRSGYPTAYVDIHARKREGKSHIRPLRDGLRFLLIIFKVGTLYSPLKVFTPVSALLFVTGLVYYLHTYFTSSRFTNMGALMFTTSIVVFLIGLVSEQITALIYQRRDPE